MRVITSFWTKLRCCGAAAVSRYAMWQTSATCVQNLVTRKSSVFVFALRICRIKVHCRWPLFQGVFQYAPPFQFTCFIQGQPGLRQLFISWGHEAGVTFVIGSFFAGIIVPDEVLHSDTLLPLQEKVSKKARLS